MAKLQIDPQYVPIFEAMLAHHPELEPMRQFLSMSAQDEPSAPHGPNGVHTQHSLILAQIAKALGACPICLGEDPLCEKCFGLGGAGSAPPDPTLFRKFIRPALVNMRRLTRTHNFDAHKEKYHERF